MLLEVEKLNVFYGPIQALRDVSFRVEEGEIVSLIGANGAGKTTIMHSISGLLKIQSGSIRYKGQEIQSMPSHKILQNGLAQVPEGRRIFRQLSVEENLTIGAYIRTDKEKVQEDIEKSLQHFPILKERFKQQAGNLSGGEQQMLAIARALMSEPKLLLLDEPSMGLSPLLVQEIFRIIRTINESGTTVLLVEQNAQLALNISSRAYVLETGRVTMEGDSKQLLQDKRIQAAYLGA